jgi:ribosome-associated protein
MIEITPIYAIDENDLQFSFVRASGPGGQNVNKVATAVQLRYDVENSNLPEEVRKRLKHLAGKKFSDEGILMIEARRFRTQEQNREDALHRLVELVRKSFEKPKARRKTKPTQASKEKRLKQKREKGEIKKIRQSRTFDS